MSEPLAQVYVDYTILSPFGPLSNSAGPFTPKDAKGFLEELKEHHKQMLKRAELRTGPKVEPKAP